MNAAQDLNLRYFRVFKDLIGRLKLVSSSVFIKIKFKYVLYRHRLYLMQFT